MVIYVISTFFGALYVSISIVALINTTLSY